MVGKLIMEYECGKIIIREYRIINNGGFSITPTDLCNTAERRYPVCSECKMLLKHTKVQTDLLIEFTGHEVTERCQIDKSIK